MGEGEVVWLQVGWGRWVRQRGRGRDRKRERRGEARKRGGVIDPLVGGVTQEGNRISSVMMGLGEGAGPRACLCVHRQKKES